MDFIGPFILKRGFYVALCQYTCQLVNINFFFFFVCGLFSLLFYGNYLGALAYSTCSGPCSQLLTWRARNLLQCGESQDLVSVSLVSVNVDVDIDGLSETWSTKSISDGDINIVGYNVYHSIRLKKGVAINIESKLNSMFVQFRLSPEANNWNFGHRL